MRDEIKETSGNSWISEKNTETNNRKDEKDALIFKFPFHNPLFQETDDILQWPFSKRILVTTYDLLKNESFTNYLVKKGLTLRDYLFNELGLNNSIEMLSDTGIFEFEAKKARLDLIPGDVIPDQLSNKSIFFAYDLINPHYLISPDEIILISDTPEERRNKINLIKYNLLQTINRFDKSKIFATLQGLDRQEIEELSKFFSDLEIKKVARGGILPLKKASKTKYLEILSLSESITRKYHISHLHAFGMSNIWSLGDYFSLNSYDSLDTSAIYWITLRKQYILYTGKQIPVRKAKLDLCICIGCQKMDRVKYWADTSGKFAISLYYHNIWQLTRITKRLLNDPYYAMFFKPTQIIQYDETLNMTKNEVKIVFKEKIENKKFDIQSKIQKIQLISVDKLNDYRKNLGSNDKIHNYRLQIRKKYWKKPTKVLILSNCTSSKKYKIPKDLIFRDVEDLRFRNELFSKFESLSIPAKQQYKGSYHEIILESLNLFSDGNDKFDITHLIMSSGYGLIEPTKKIVPYDCTFNYKSVGEVEKMIDILNLKDQVTNKILHPENEFDIVISTMSKTYQSVLNYILSGMDLSSFFSSRETIWITSKLDQKYAAGMQKNWIEYTTDEFYIFFKLGIVPRIPGNRWHAKANVLFNYLYHLKYKNNNELMYFFDYWHSKFQCFC